MSKIEINYVGQPNHVPLKLNPEVLDQFVQAHPITKKTLKRIDIDYTKTIANHSTVLGNYSFSSQRMNLYPEKFAYQPGNTVDQLLETSLHELYHATDQNRILLENATIGLGVIALGYLATHGLASVTTVEINDYTIPTEQLQGILEILTAIPRVIVLKKLLAARWLPTEQRADNFSKNPQNKSHWQNLVYLDNPPTTRRRS